MKRDAFTLPLDLGHELIIDNFAGGGGTSTGLEAAFGRPVDIAINHDPEALAMHALNHPHTWHLLESVWDVNPIAVTGNRPVALVWLSPDCKHFSKAKGGTPVAKHIRGLAWVGMRWVALTKPRVLMLENVEEFTTWGPLLVGADGTARPDPARKGKTFESFVRQLRGHGYQVEWRELRACDHGAPTIRKRLFLVARRDGLPIVWPEPTHGDPTSREVLAGKLLPWRTAAECIDFSLPSQSIFGRERALATNTLRRVAKGLWRHVLTSPKPFIVGVGGRMGQSPERPIDKPLQTITAKADSCVAQPVLAPFVSEHANASNQRNMAADEPLRTVCAQVKGGHFSVVAPTLAPMVMTNTTGHPGAPMDAPLSTVTTGGHHAVVAPVIAPLRGTDDSHLQGDAIEAPLSTVSAGGTHHALAGASLIQIGYGERSGQEPRALDITRPLGTVVAGGVKHAVVEGAFITKFRANSVGHDLQEPLHTVTANSFVKRPGGSVPMGIVAAHLVDAGHGEGKDGSKRFSHGVRSAEKPLNTVTASGATSAVAALHLTHLTHHGDRAGNDPAEPLRTVTGAHRGEQALVSACIEQANGGFYADNSGRSANEPLSTITSKGANQRLIAAYCVKYYGNERDGVSLLEPMHTLPTKDRMGLVEVEQVPADCLAPELRERARLCAALLHEHLPEQFPVLAELVLMFHKGQWWVLVDITLRMLKAPELYLAQSFPANYVIHEIPNPTLLFKGGVQAADPLVVPRIKLSATAQVRMCGNSVAPAQAEALVRANFAHELLIYGRAAA
ncbi:DNA cytosine methyltransferase [Variovorax atrisoli]|uniref:DNA cytosine methyltransferase n=1 Tax=Variovorax atrisoli TaxID=3394203 RepID=UPI00160F4C48|nr:DNA cytosine methyltransferase [Variovorax sp. BK613]MBB3642579.1 DNA (cytosine-5)-methyltransferase 1 [Variovorax sp. BK613]